MPATALRNKTLILSSMTFTVMALLIFLPAGTLRYWQAWLYLAVFIGFSSLISWYLFKNNPRLLENRMGMGPFAEPNPDQKIIQTVNSVLTFGVFIVSGADFGAHGARVPAILVLLANLLILLAAWVLFLVVKENAFAAGTIKIQNGQKVIATGPYSVVRHPMYSAAMLLFFATPLALASLWGLGAAALLSVGVVVRLLREERYLRTELPGYAEYCQKVRYRLVPAVW